MDLNIRSALEANEMLFRAAEESCTEVETRDILDANGKPLRGKDDERLSIKTLVVGNPDAKHRIWLTTGIHGVERFAGTVFLSWLLEHKRQICSLLGHDICIIAVDDLSPWGSSYLSRFDQDGVDDNRNFHPFKEEIVVRPVPQPYRLIDDMVNPKSFTLLSDVGRIMNILWFRRLRGDKAFMKIIGVGQRHSGDKLLFTGHKPSQTNLTLREILRKHTFPTAGHDVHLDIHTGLGPSIIKHDPMLITIYKPEGMEQARAKFFFGDRVVSTRENNGYTASGFGTIENAFFDELPEERIYTGVCVELGTIPIAWVVMYMRWRFLTLRNGGWRRKHGLYQNITEHLVLKAFFPPSGKWREAIVPKTWPVFKRAIHRLKEM